MADVTFGVKVPEEMKNELAEMMKNTQLTGKEFMGVLLSAYKLERQKQSDNVLVQDIDELQRLLSRIQNMYLNMGERVSLLVEDRVSEVEQILGAKEEEKIGLLEEQEILKETLKKLEEEKEVTLKAFKEEKEKLEAEICGLKQEKEALEEVIQEQKQQMKQQHVLCDKYEEEIVRLKEENSKWERLELEIEERTAENERLQVRNDEIASELWFSQREIEKNKETLQLEIEKYTQELISVKDKYDLELKNALLEQNLIFNEERARLQEKHYSDMQQLQDKIQQILLKEENTKE